MEFDHDKQQSPKQLLVIILNQPEKLSRSCYKKFYDANIPGATILNSVGGFGAHSSWLEDVGLHRHHAHVPAEGFRATHHPGCDGK